MSKSHPILFSAPMVRAILAGNKTQTRRVAKGVDLKITHHDDGISWCAEFNPAIKSVTSSTSGGPFTESQARQIIANQFAPYKPGDRLWVRETWGYLGGTIKYPEGKSNSVVHYHADGVRREISHASPDQMIASMPQQKLVYPQEFDDLPDWQQRQKYHELLNDWWRKKKKIVSIHMPRWASRIELEVTAVRIERLQSISEVDAVAEGARRFDGIPIGTPFKYGNPCRWSMDDAPPNTDHCLSSARYAFGNIWERIHGPGSWEENPWVWVYEFKVVS